MKKVEVSYFRQWLHITWVRMNLLCMHNACMYAIYMNACMHLCKYLCNVCNVYIYIFIYGYIYIYIYIN